MNFAATGSKGAGRIINVFKHGIAVGRRRHIGFQADDAAATGFVVRINDDTGGIFDALNHRPRKLARAAKDVLHARKASMEERRQIAKEARDKLLQEQQERLEEMRGSDGMSEQLENRIKGILLGRE